VCLPCPLLGAGDASPRKAPRIRGIGSGTASSPHEKDDDPTVAVVAVEETGLSVRFILLKRSTEAFSG